MSEFLPIIREHDVVEVYEYDNRPFLLGVRNHQGELPLRTVFTSSPTGVLCYNLRFNDNIEDGRVQVITDLTALEEYLPTPSYRLARAEDSPKEGKP